MRKTNFAFIFLVIIIINSCARSNEKVDGFKLVDNALTENQQKFDEQKEIANALRINQKWIFDTIFSLNEVKERAEFISNHTKGASHLSISIVDPNDSTKNYYLVKAIEDNGTNSVTHFNFYVYTHPIKILFYDTIKDTLLDIKTWRKNIKKK